MNRGWFGVAGMVVLGASVMSGCTPARPPAEAPSAPGATSAAATAPSAAAAAAPSATAAVPSAAAAAPSAAPAVAASPSAVVSAPPATPLLAVRSIPAPGTSVVGSAAYAATPIADRPALPTRYAQAIGPYGLYLEVIASASPSQFGLLASPGCVIDSIFKRGMRMVWRFEIVDSTTSKLITDRDGATAKIQMQQGDPIVANFFPRGPVPPPPDAPWTWVAVWNVPLDYPLGDLPFTIALTTSNGKSTTIDPADFGAKFPQIVD